MLDIKKVIDNKEKYIELLNRRGSDFESLINDVVNLYNEYCRVTSENENIAKEINQKSKLIGEYKREGKDVSPLMEEIEKLKNQKKDKYVKELFEKYELLMLQIPNIPAEDVPIGKDDSENVEVHVWGEKRNFDFPIKSHEDIGENLGDFDFQRASKISKSRFVIERNLIAKLERAIMNLMLDTHAKNGYIEYNLPVVVNQDTLYASGQLPKFEKDLFKLQNQGEEFSENAKDFYLIPTAEVVLANLYRDEIIDENILNANYCAYTRCFRKEAGSAGRDTKGIIRMHEFGKVELFKYTTPETSYQELDNMVNDAKRILELLELPYRVVKLCSGDMGFNAMTTYDLEVWFPSQNKYRECSSCSNVGDFQARRGKIRYKKDGEIIYPHMLNGSGMATGRILAAVIENYQNEDGTITIPKVLEKYINI